MIRDPDADALAAASVIRKLKGSAPILENGGTIENAHSIADHESPRTTKLYDLRSDEISLDEVERIAI